MVLSNFSILQSDVLRVDLDEVLCVAYARPAAIIHVASALAAADKIQIQSVA